MGDPRADLAELIKGKSDDDIIAGLKAQGGAEQAVTQIMNGMVEAFLADKAAGQSAVIQYDVAGADGKISFQLVVKDGTCTAAANGTETPRVTLALSVPDFFRLVTGQLNGMQAFMSGKLKLTGDMMFAQTMQGWFKQG